MINKRFFAFGCSYTRWCWPTWADLIGYDFDDYYNYGHQGAGNHYIFNAVMEADVRHKITRDDLVIVQFSSITREDRYADDHWQTKGTIVNHDSDFIKKYFDFKGFFIRDMAFIKAVIDFLRNVGCEFYLLSMNPLTSKNEFFVQHDTSISDVIEFYKEYVDMIKPSYIETLSYTRPLQMKNGRMLHDNHPLPIDHYDYLSCRLPKFAKNKELAIEWTDIVSTLNGDFDDLWSKQIYPDIFPILNRSKKKVTRL